jgi:APA family basic amino acid/polyamine antiporter
MHVVQSTFPSWKKPHDLFFRRLRMAEQKAPEMKATLGLTGLTSNAMALIAPGAFLWLTFYLQATEINAKTSVSTAPAMWLGIIVALLLCLATAVAYAEISKLYPGTGSSYYYAEQALLSKDKAFKYARIAKFIVGWGSHLYYWVYPGVMVAVTGLFVGYVVGFLYPGFMNGTNPGPVFMGLVAVAFSFFVAWIASKGAGASTTVNIGINIIQISALIVFSVLAIHYRVSHPTGAPAAQYDSQTLATYPYAYATRPDGTVVRAADGTPQPQLDAAGKPVPFTISYPEKDASGNFLTHSTAASVVAPHNISWVFVQATVAILILVGFESVTSMGGEAKNPTKHIPIAVVASLLIQGLVCYLIEYFAANYFLNSGYTMQSAAGSAAPIGDMMILVGDGLLGRGNGRYFMLAEAVTVFLALIGTTLSCMNTGARVTYAMGKDDEAPEHFGILHAESLSPRRAIWALAIISAVIGVVAVSLAFGDGSAPTDAAIAALPHGVLSSFGYPSHDALARLPNSLLTLTLTSNFGTFILYSLSCLLAIVAYYKRPDFNFVLHMLIPGFGLLANLVCMAFYIIGPWQGFGTPHEPLLALLISALWGGYGAIYFMRSSKVKGKSALVAAK